MVVTAEQTSIFSHYKAKNSNEYTKQNFDVSLPLTNTVSNNKRIALDIRCVRRFASGEKTNKPVLNSFFI